MRSLMTFYAVLMVLCGCGLLRADDYSAPRLIAEVRDPRINEASGLIASRRYPGHYYTHNDSGGRPEVYLLNERGAVAGVIHLRGAVNRDWEDIAWVFPADGWPAGRIVVGDIGDNRRRYPEVVLYRFEEPEIPGLSRPDEANGEKGELNVDAPTVILDPEVIRLRYPDEPHNAEGLIVDPGSGDAYIFTKQEDGRSRVYRLAFPWDASRVTTLEAFGELNFTGGGILTMVTAADISPDGRRLVTRSYPGGWLFELTDDVPSNERMRKLFAVEPRPIQMPAERQGEAVAFTIDGRSLLTISEGSPTALWRLDANR